MFSEKPTYFRKVVPPMLCMGEIILQCPEITRARCANPLFLLIVIFFIKEYKNTRIQYNPSQLLVGGTAPLIRNG